MNKVLLMAVAGIPAFVISSAGTRFLEPRLRRHGVLDVANPRSSHIDSTPRGGGIAIAVAFTAVALTTPILMGTGLAELEEALAISAIFFGVGLLDDLYHLSVSTRLSVELLTVAAVMPRLTGIELASSGPAVAFFLALTFALVCFINAFNFMDGIDGIAAITGLSFSLIMIVHGSSSDTPGLVIVGSALGAACLGFLLFNWHPASIFMGDAGSLFLGALIFASIFRTTSVAAPNLVLLAPLIPFISDAGLTIAYRLWHRRPITEAHRDHLYQLAARRWGHPRVSASYGSVSFVAGLLAVGVSRLGTHALIVGLAVATVAASATWLALYFRLSAAAGR